MYNELYEAWKREKEYRELQPLSKDFYTKLAEYIRKLRAENRMLDERTTKAKLLTSESKNVQRMVEELVLLRHEKTIKNVLTAETFPMEDLTQEEEKLVSGMTPLVESFQALLNSIIGGRLPKSAGREKPKKQVLRFRKEIPAIIGADMKTYGPFKPEDIASVPLDNAKFLTKQGVAVEVEVKL